MPNEQRQLPNEIVAQALGDTQRRNARNITTLDLNQGYNQPLLPDSRSITAFTVPGMGLCQFKRMPYGLSFTGATFQRLIDKVIRPEMEPYAFSLFDDVNIATQTFKCHVKCMKHILGRIKEADLTVNLEGYVFGKTEVRYIKILVHYDGFQSNPEKTKQVTEYPTQRNLKQLRRFLSMAS